ncbi:hypothetical protein MGWOODY_Smn1754 [hydrothermal vent metagenome]|jgi:hypothetical protein|uniref:Uncharacterized protein n=1 Tax=hydrothermal vent metagenome TaxID=652676 RepID=A0A170PNX1_9ZZZZ
MRRVKRTPPRGLFQDHDRFSGGIAFLILIFISVALWAWLIFSFA